MRFVDRGFGVFVYRHKLTDEIAAEMRRAGIRHVVLEVMWQSDKPQPQITATGLRRQQDIARAAGLEVHWFGWIVRDGVTAMAKRLRTLIDGAGMPASFIANCEVTKSERSWSTYKPDFRPLAAALRALELPEIGLTSHGIIGDRWTDEAFDFGVPQLYAGPPLTERQARSWCETWDVPLWPALGCSDTSPASEMARDLETLESIGCRSALWWSSRSLMAPAKLAVSVPRRRERTAP